MNIQTAVIAKGIRNKFNLILPVALFVLFTCCGNNSNTADSESTEPNVVEITAVGLQFEAPDSIPSGWTTVRLNNSTEMIHFALFQKFPEGLGLEDHQEEVAPVFQNIMNDINGKDPAEPDAGFAPPEWYSDVQLMGGPGLVSAGRIAETTLHLEPGTYLVECYVKTDGIFHSYNPSPQVYGMAVEITVTEDSTSANAPEPTASVNISSEKGIQVDGDLSAGSHIVEVNFDDQSTYENFVGHDVHLFKVTDETDLDAVSEWMNWAIPNGLGTPAPAEFIGGANDMPEGSTTYIHVNLEPGDYAWIAEVPNPAEKDMLKTFTVSSE